MDRLTETGVKGIVIFCTSCSDKPLFGKCGIGNECYHRQVFKELAELENKIERGELVEIEVVRKTLNSYLNSKENIDNIINDICKRRDNNENM